MQMEDNLYQDSPNTQTKVGVSQSSSPIPVSTTQTGLDFGSFFSNILIFLLICFGLVGVGVLVYRKLKRKAYENKRVEDWEKTVFIEVSVPKETAEQSQKDAGSGKKDDKEVLAIGEQLFTLMSEYAQDQKKTNFYGGERFSLEIVNINQEIKFWLACSNDTAEVIERQIVAIYNKAHIVRLTKLDFFKEKTVSHAQELSLNLRYELPFKTYRLIDGDPLNTLSNAMGGMSKEESVGIQLIVTPIKDWWQKNPRVLASKINQGFNPKNVLFPESPKISKILWKALKGFVGSFFKGASDDKDKAPDKDREQSLDLSGKKQNIQLTPQQQEIIKKLEEKASRPGFIFTLRIVASANNEKRAKQIVDGVVPAFQIFDIKPFNGFKKKKVDVQESTLNFLMRSHSYQQKEILNTEEINSIWHLPNYLTQTPNIKWLLSRRPAIPLNIPPNEPGNVYIGQAVSRGQTKDCYLKPEDRFRHIYSLGGSGSGKTVEMISVALQDIEMGNGICFVDPHGEGVDDILRRIPEHRMEDVVLFSPAIIDLPMGLNMLETDPLKPTQKTLVIDTLFTIWDKLYDLKKTGGPMFENYMKNSMRLVMSHPESGSTLMEISKVLSDEDFRSFKLAMCDEPEVVDFWEKEATKAGGEASLENMVPYITSKLAPFVTNDFLKPMIGQQKSAINWRQAMDNNKIILVSLSKGMIGENSAYLVGMVILGGLLMAGMGRSDGLKYNMDGTTSEVIPDQRPPFFVYVDEMQNFLFDAIPKALEEIRKYKVGFYLAHQFIKQVVVQGDERIKDSIMSNCATKFIYRCSSDDASYLEKEFSPLSIQDIANPEARTYNAIMLVDGQRTTPFNIQAKFPIYTDILDKNHPERIIAAEEKRKKIVNMSKQKYGKPREEVEKEIKDRAKLLF
jgi:TraM recognition site of TraD and TraG